MSTAILIIAIVLGISILLMIVTGIYVAGSFIEGIGRALFGEISNNTRMDDICLIILALSTISTVLNGLALIVLSIINACL